MAVLIFEIGGKLRRDLKAGSLYKAQNLLGVDMQNKVVDFPTHSQLEAWFLGKLADIRKTAQQSSGPAVSEALTVLAVALKGHWVHVRNAELTNRQRRALSLFSVVLMLEVVEVVRTSWVGGRKGLGLLAAPEWSRLVGAEFSTLEKRFATIRYDWKLDDAWCTWAEHLWVLSEADIGKR